MTTISVYHPNENLFFLNLLSDEGQRLFISSLAQEINQQGKASIGYGSGKDICMKLQEWHGIQAVHSGNIDDGNVIKKV